MSFKCLILVVLLGCIGAGLGEEIRTHQPIPVEQQLRQSKDLRYPNEELLNADDEDGDDIVEHELDEAAELELDQQDLDALDDASVAELTKLIDRLEAAERIESRASRGQGGSRRGSSKQRRNRSGSKRRRNRNGPSRRRHNRRGKGQRKGNKRYRNGRRRKNGSSKVQTQ